MAFYFADVVSDVLVMLEFLATPGFVDFGVLSAAFIGLQYLGAHVGVVMWLSTVYGGSGSCCGYAILGFPLGPILLDLAMFFEPINYYVRWMPGPLQALLPSYRTWQATRAPMLWAGVHHSWGCGVGM